MSGSKVHVRTDVDKRQVERMVQFLANSAKELGCSVKDIELGAGLKAGVATQWKSRLKHNHITKIRPSTMESIYKEVARRKKHNNEVAQAILEAPERASFMNAKMQHTDPKKPSAPTVVVTEKPDWFDNIVAMGASIPVPQTATIPRRTGTACEALSNIVKTKLAGMSLVQLAHLLEFMETGNGNGQ